jgi:hypothetical protein
MFTMPSSGGLLCKEAASEVHVGEVFYEDTALYYFLYRGIQCPGCARAMLLLPDSDPGLFNGPPCILLFSPCKTIASMIACKGDNPGLFNFLPQEELA